MFMKLLDAIIKVYENNGEEQNMKCYINKLQEYKVLEN